MKALPQWLKDFAVILFNYVGGVVLIILLAVLYACAAIFLRWVLPAP